MEVNALAFAAFCIRILLSDALNTPQTQIRKLEEEALNVTCELEKIVKSKFGNSG